MNKITKCPDCGAELNYDSDREFMFCQYCGAKIMVGEHKTVHIVDEAKILKEQRKMTRLERFEAYQERQLERSRKETASFLRGFLVFIALTLVGLIVAILYFMILHPDKLGVETKDAIAMLVIMSACLAAIVVMYILKKKKK